MTEPQGVALLGSTGSIGTSALRVLARQRDRFRPVALTAHGRQAALAAQVAEWTPAYVGLVQGDAEAPATWGRGPDCLVAAAEHPDVSIVLNAVVGAAGLPATLAALRAGRRVALANKETLVVGGALVTATARAHGGTLVPVDSEHSAILQCLAGRQPHEVRRLLLTASGGRSGNGPPTGSPPPRCPTRCGIRRGRWAARSPSTAPRWPTRRWR